METFTYRRVDDQVLIVSNQPHGGPSEPETSHPMAPSEAIERLREFIWVPGRLRATWTKGWQPAAGARHALHISLDTLDESQVKEFKRRASAIASSAYGVGPRQQIPPQMLMEYREKLLRVVRDLGG